MAFPVVESTAVSGTGISTSHAVTLPAGIVAGDLLIAVLVVDANINITGYDGDADWTPLTNNDNIAQGGGAIHSALAYRLATGTDGLTFTTQVNTESAHAVYRISGAEDPATQAPEAAAPASLGASTEPDPSSTTPTGGAKDYLWVAWEGHDDTSTTDDVPTNYVLGDLISIQTTGGPSVGAVARTNNAASEDPDVFTLSFQEPSLSGTIAVHPAGGTIPGTGAIDIAGAAPSIALDLQTAKPDAGEVSLAGAAPTVAVDFAVAPDAGAIDIAGAAPTIVLSQVVKPAAGALDVAGAAPAVDLAVAPDAGEISLAGAAPTVTVSAAGETVIPDAGEISLAGDAPVIVLSQVVKPGAGALDIAGDAPTILGGSQTATPGTGEISMAGAAPELLLDLQKVTPDAGEISVAGAAPTVIASQVVQPDAGALNIAGAAPTVIVSQVVTPAAGAVDLAGAAPTVLAGKTVTTDTGAIVIAGIAPKIIVSQVVRPATGGVDVGSDAPTVNIVTEEADEEPRPIRWYIKGLPSQRPGERPTRPAGPARFISGKELASERKKEDIEDREPVPVSPETARRLPFVTQAPVPAPAFPRKLSDALLGGIDGPIFSAMLDMQEDMRFIRRKPKLVDSIVETVAPEQDNFISDDDVAVILALVVGL